MPREYNPPKKEDKDNLDAFGENLDKLTSNVYDSIFNWKQAVRHENWNEAETYRTESAEAGIELRKNLLEYRNMLFDGSDKEVTSEEFQNIRSAEWAIEYLLKAGSHHEFREKQPETGDFVLINAGPEESKLKILEGNYESKTFAPYEEECLKPLRQQLLE